MNAKGLLLLIVIFLCVAVRASSDLGSVYSLSFLQGLQLAKADLNSATVGPWQLTTFPIGEAFTEVWAGNPKENIFWVQLGASEEIYQLEPSNNSTTGVVLSQTINAAHMKYIAATDEIVVLSYFSDDVNAHLIHQGSKKRIIHSAAATTKVVICTIKVKHKGGGALPTACGTYFDFPVYWFYTGMAVSQNGDSVYYITSPDSGPELDLHFQTKHEHTSSRLKFNSFYRSGDLANGIVWRGTPAHPVILCMGAGWNNDFFNVSAIDLYTLNPRDAAPVAMHKMRLPCVGHAGNPYNCDQDGSFLMSEKTGYIAALRMSSRTAHAQFASHTVIDPESWGIRKVAHFNWAANVSLWYSLIDTLYE